MFINHIALFVAQLGDPLSRPACGADHISLCPDTPGVFSKITGRVGKVMDLEAHADDGNLSTHERRIGHFPEERLCDPSNKLDIIMGNKTLEHDFCCDDMFLDYIAAKILDEVDDYIVLVDPPLVRNRDKCHGFSPISAK